MALEHQGKELLWESVGRQAGRCSTGKMLTDGRLSSENVQLLPDELRHRSKTMWAELPDTLWIWGRAKLCNLCEANHPVLEEKCAQEVQQGKEFRDREEAEE